MSSKYFKLEELLQSATALNRKVANLPSWEVIDNLQTLALFLDDMRDAWGSGIVVTSGFRNLQLNKLVGGVNSSAHQTGYAADIVPANGRFTEFENFLKGWLKDKMFDECLWEKSASSSSRWIHIALFSVKGLQRRKMFGVTAK